MRALYGMPSCYPAGASLAISMLLQRMVIKGISVMHRRRFDEQLKKRPPDETSCRQSLYCYSLFIFRWTADVLGAVVSLTAQSRCRKDTDALRFHSGQMRRVPDFYWYINLRVINMNRPIAVIFLVLYGIMDADAART
jgi:hypothetical protein